MVKISPLVPISYCSGFKLGRNLYHKPVTAVKVTGEMNEPARELRSLACGFAPSQEGSQLFARVESVYVVRDDALFWT